MPLQLILIRSKKPEERRATRQRQYNGHQAKPQHYGQRKPIVVNSETGIIEG